MLSKKKVEKILILHDQGLSMRKIAKRLKISKNTALRYIQLERYSIEIPHIHRTRDTEFHTNIETNNIVGEYFPIKRYEPHGSISFQGMSSHELQNTYNPIPHCYKYTCELPHVEEEILFDHSSREPNYNEDMNYGYQHVETPIPDLPSIQIKHITPEKSIMTTILVDSI